MVHLGSRVRDLLTGFEGIAVARITFLYGCVHIAVLPTDLKDGSPQKDHLFDEQRMEVLTATDRPEATLLHPLGSTVRDTITGLEGVVSVWVDELSHAPVISITSKQLHEGNPIDTVYMPQARCELVTKTVAPVSEDSSASSGSMAGKVPLSSSRNYR